MLLVVYFDEDFIDEKCITEASMAEIESIVEPDSVGNDV